MLTNILVVPIIYFSTCMLPLKGTIMKIRSPQPVLCQPCHITFGGSLFLILDLYLYLLYLFFTYLFLLVIACYMVANFYLLTNPPRLRRYHLQLKIVSLG